YTPLFRSDQSVVLGRIGIEERRVCRKALRLPRPHADAETPAQALLLVQLASEAAVALDLSFELEQPGLFARGHLRSGVPAQPTSSRCARAASCPGSCSTVGLQCPSASSRFPRRCAI